MTLGMKICELRKRLGVSQEELASQIGVSRQTISKWERDESLPELDKVKALSAIFSISTDYLLLDSLDTIKDQVRQGDEEQQARGDGYRLNWSKVAFVSGLALFAPAAGGIIIWNILMGTYGHTMDPEMEPAKIIVEVLIYAMAAVSVGLTIAGAVLMARTKKKDKNDTDMPDE